MKRLKLLFVAFGLMVLILFGALYYFGDAVRNAFTSFHSDKMILNKENEKNHFRETDSLWLPFVESFDVNYMHRLEGGRKARMFLDSLREVGLINESSLPND